MFDIFTDATLIAASVNTINTFINLFWTWQLKKLQANGETIKFLREQVQEKNDAIQALKESKERYKNNYQSQLSRNKELQGQINTYQKFHQHAED